MGRHSAPDDEDEDLDVSGTLTAVRAEDSPTGSSPRGGGRHSRADVDERSDERSDAGAGVELFRPYTGVFGPSSAADVDAVAEAHTTELPAVVDDAPTTTIINGAGPAAEPHTDTADLGAPVDALEPAVEDAAEPAAEPAVEDVAPSEPSTEPTAEPAAEVAADPDATAGTSAPGTEPTTADRAPSGTRADLALLRSHPGLRARAAAAVLAPFVLYVIVLAVLARFDQALLWVWIPIIVAGVAFGLVLDLAQRAQERQRKETPDSSAP